MTIVTKSPLELHVILHPEYALGGKLTEALITHFNSIHYRNVTGGAGIFVFKHEITSLSFQSRDQSNLEDADISVLIFAIDQNFANDTDCRKILREWSTRSSGHESDFIVIPVVVDSEVKVSDLKLDLHALSWHGLKNEHKPRFLHKLTYELCRMLRERLSRKAWPGAGTDNNFESYLEKFQVFLSHTKLDRDGENIARKIRRWINNNSALSTFIDVVDIPAGLRFEDVILSNLNKGALVAIHTDLYSSRVWCRREVIESKRHNIPMLVVNSLREFDERGFPYLGNVPIIRIDPDRMTNIEQTAYRILDEIFKDLLWRYVTEEARVKLKEVLFIPRTPELIVLTCPSACGKHIGKEQYIVYPDPPLGGEEQKLFSLISNNIQLRSLTEWMGESEI